MFAFDLYDRDASGKIEVKEVEQMMREGSFYECDRSVL